MKGVENMCDKNEIIKLFYIEHMNCVAIARLLHITKQYTSRIVNLNPRHSMEKAYQSTIRSQNRKIKDRESKRAKREQERLSRDIMNVQHNKDVIEISHSKYEYKF